MPEAFDTVGPFYHQYIHESSMDIDNAHRISEYRSKWREMISPQDQIVEE